MEVQNATCEGLRRRAGSFIDGNKAIELKERGLVGNLNNGGVLVGAKGG